MSSRQQPTLRTAQQLGLAPQLQQAMRLLQLSSQALAEEVGRALADNPFLERVEDPGPEDAVLLAPGLGVPASGPGALAGPAQDPPLAPAGDAPDDTWLDGLPSRFGSTAAVPEWADASAPESLADHLLQQVAELRLLPEEAAALRFLVGSLDDDGYLRDSLAELAASLVDDGDDMGQLQALVQRLRQALQRLQTLDPAGVGARSLAHCLLLQLQRQLEAATVAQPRQLLQAAIRVCGHEDGLRWLAERRLDAVAAATGLDPEQVAGLMHLVASLEPKPGRRFADLRQLVVTPDVQVQVRGEGSQRRLQVRLTQQAVPPVQVHAAYAATLDADGAASASLQQLLQEARWLVQGLQQRADTLLRVATAIVHRQRRFFELGELAMQPLTRADIATQLQLHESTVSRATAGKYMVTPRGTLELAFFFSSAVGMQAGGQVSSTAVKALLRQLIDAEDPARPLSDASLSALLEAEGIRCARRTVAKYREALGIAGARRRKR